MTARWRALATFFSISSFEGAGLSAPDSGLSALASAFLSSVWGASATTSSSGFGSSGGFSGMIIFTSRSGISSSRTSSFTSRC